jgi:hypothetical protein
VQVVQDGSVTFIVAPEDAGEELIARMFLWDLQQLLEVNQVLHRTFFGRTCVPDAVQVPLQAYRAQFWLDEVRALFCEASAVVH